MNLEKQLKKLKNRVAELEAEVFGEVVTIDADDYNTSVFDCDDIEEEKPSHESAVDLVRRLLGK